MGFLYSLATTVVWGFPEIWVSLYPTNGASLGFPRILARPVVRILSCGLPRILATALRFCRVQVFPCNEATTPSLGLFPKRKNFWILTSPLSLVVSEILSVTDRHYELYARTLQALCLINRSTQHTHLIKSNSWQVQNSCLFWHQCAILRDFLRTKEYKPNTPIVGIASPLLEWLKY